MEEKAKEVKFLWTDPARVVGMMTTEEWKAYSKGREFRETEDSQLFKSAEWVKGIACNYNLNYYNDALEIAEPLFLDKILLPKSSFPLAFTDDGGNIVILIAPAVEDEMEDADHVAKKGY